MDDSASRLPAGVIDRVVGPVSTHYLTDDDVVSVPHATTEDEQRELMGHLARHVPEIEKDVARQVDELLDLLRPHNPLSVIAGVWLSNAILDADAFKEYEHRGNDAFTEYVAALYLTRPFSLGDSGGIAPLAGELFEDVQSRVEALFRDSTALAATSWIDADDPAPADGLDSIAFRVRMQALTVRYPGYDVHLQRTLRGIFERSDDAIERTLGVTGSRAVDLCVALDRLIEVRVNAQMTRAMDSVEGLLASVAALTPDTIPTDASPFLRHVVTLPPDAQRDAARWAAMTWASTFMGFTLVLTAHDLAEHAGTTVDEAAALLDLLSVGFGGVDPAFFLRPSSTSPLQANPVVRLTPDEHALVTPGATAPAYFCPVPNALLWALRPAVEAALNPASAVAVARATKSGWQAYESGRAQYAEDRALELLASLLPGATAHASVTYPVGESETAELDGILALDDALFLVEVKAGSMHDAARRGAKRTLKRDVQETLTAAHRQARRAQAYVASASPATFMRTDGELYSVPTAATRVFLLAVTLEPLDAVTSNAHQAERAGLFDVVDGAARDYPWAVSLYDLEIVADTFGRAAEFTHFLDRRLAAQAGKRVSAHGELDWLGRYLAEGLDFEEEFARRPGAHLNLLTYTTGFDDYYLYTYGGRTAPAPLPAQPLPSPLDEILDGLAASGAPGFLAAAEMLLDVPHDERAKLASFAQNVRTTAHAEQRYSDTTGVQIGGSGNAPFGITLMAGPEGTDPDDLQTRLIGYAALKKYQTRADRWLCIGTVPGTEPWLSVALTLAGPWAYDALTDHAAGELLPDLPEAVRQHPSVRAQSRTVKRTAGNNPRNKLCACGSGRKSKHCGCHARPGLS